MTESELDELAIIRAQNRQLRAALKAQLLYNHQLNACLCQGCKDTRKLLHDTYQSTLPPSRSPSPLSDDDFTSLPIG